MRKYNKGLTFLLITAFVLAVYVSAAGFKDIKETDWFAEAVGKLNALKIIDGLPDGSFNPQGQVTRAQFVKMLVQAMEYKKIDSVSFEDLKPFPTSKPHWACVYIETALRNGVIVKSEIGDNFYPDVPLTRRDMGMMMFRALKLKPSEGENPFADMTEADGCFIKLYEEYLIRGIIEGGKRLYKPEGLTTRAEAAVIISRMVEYKADPAEYVRSVGLETRIKEGIATEEDLKTMRDKELQKQAADKNYIIKPEFKIYRDEESSLYKTYYYSIKLDNYKDYADDAQIRGVCISDKTQNSAWGQDAMLRWHKSNYDVWKPLRQFKDANINLISLVRKKNGNYANGEYKGYLYNYEPGTVLVYEIQIKRGTSLQKYLVEVVIR